MTHDELLAKVDLITGLAEEQMGITGLNIHKALRAVVELHKPKSSEYFEGDVCETCSWDLDYYTPYPCPTIQAVEKELHERSE